MNGKSRPKAALPKPRQEFTTPNGVKVRRVREEPRHIRVVLRDYLAALADVDRRAA